MFPDGFVKQFVVGVCVCFLTDWLTVFLELTGFDVCYVKLRPLKPSDKRLNSLGLMDGVHLSKHIFQKHLDVDVNWMDG